jgi:hypothetical protein
MGGLSRDHPTPEWISPGLKIGIKTLAILILALSMTGVALGVCARDEILYDAAPHFPPWDLNPIENASSGINADVIRAIANDVGLRAQPIPCP